MIPNIEISRKEAADEPSSLDLISKTELGDVSHINSRDHVVVIEQITEQCVQDEYANNLPASP